MAEGTDAARERYSDAEARRRFGTAPRETPDMPRGEPHEGIAGKSRAAERGAATAVDAPTFLQARRQT